MNTSHGNLIPSPEIGMSPEAWLEASQRPHLDDRVPQDVRTHFAIARGSLAYGAFSTPVLYLAGAQILRSAECAIRVRSNAAGVTDPFTSFATRLEFLLDRKLLTESAHARWEQIRRFRNDEAHRIRSSSLEAGWYLARLEEVALLVRELFQEFPPSSCEPEECQVSASSWLAVKPVFAEWAGPRWRERLSGAVLAASVPMEVREPYEQAQAAMKFGEYYLVIGSLIAEATHHIAVLALEIRCGKLITPRRARKMPKEKLVEKLLGAGVLDAARAKGLEPVLFLRDEVSHPKTYGIFAPWMQIRMFELLAEDLNHIFR